MAQHGDTSTTSSTSKAASGSAVGPGNAVSDGGDHDRVVMLSLNADGSPHQHNPEIIGDKEFATAAARRQFAEQAVSAVDTQMRGVTAGPDGTDGERDPDVLKPAHEDAQTAAHARAEATVDALHRGVGA